MKELVKSSQEISRIEISAKDAIKMFDDMGESYKVEIIKEIDSDEVISAYKQSEFTDLCRGPHVSNTSKAFSFQPLRRLRPGGKHTLSRWRLYRSSRHHSPQITPSPQRSISCCPCSLIGR